MSVAIPGGTGFLGTAIAHALVARGADTVQIARGQMTQMPVAGARFAAADRTDGGTLDRLFADHRVDTVIDVMTLTLATTQPLLNATARAGARYVMISAIDVTANYGGLARLENPPVLKRPAREEDPVRKTLYPYRHLSAKPAGIDPQILRDYDKIPIEIAARASADLRALILRMPAIYGPGDRQGRFAWLKAALQADGPIRMDARAAHWQQSFIYIDDAADAVARAALSHIPPRTLHIATPHHRTMADWAARFAQAAGFDREVTTCPLAGRGLMAERAEMMDMRYPLTLNGTAFTDSLGPVERTPEAEAIAATLDAGL